MAHRVQPVEQIVSPDLGAETLESVSESQLRGYLMLIAAKLPIVENLALYLSEVVEQLDEGVESGSGELSLLQREFGTLLAEVHAAA